MARFSERAALRALETLRDPITDRDLVSAGRVSDLTYEDGRLRVILALDPATTQAQGLALRDGAEAALAPIGGVNEVAVLLTSHKSGPTIGAAQRPAPPSGTGAKAMRNPHPNRRPEGRQGDRDVAHVIAVSSAKGGVGKSTVTAGLARALAASGKRVGILDADVHGPSQPHLLGVSGQLTTREIDGRRLIIPAQSGGVKVISIGLLTGSDDPVVWRGPMVQGAISRMLWDTDWGALDVLLIDMPPGTGDPQLGLAQDIKPKGAVIVTTPQDLALMDARKGVAMFEKVDIPVLGWVENMAHFTCPDCGSTHHIFGNGDLSINTQKLGSLPLSLEMRAAASGYEDLAASFWDTLSSA